MAYPVLVATSDDSFGWELSGLLGNTQIARFAPTIARDWRAMLEQAVRQPSAALMLDVALIADMSSDACAKELAQAGSMLTLLIDEEHGRSRRGTDVGFAHLRIDEHACTGEAFMHLLNEAIARHALQRRAHRRRGWGQVVLDAIGDGVVITDCEGEVSYLNAVAESLTGWRHADAVGESADEVVVMAWAPTGQALSPHPVASALASVQSARVPPRTVLLRPDGSTVPIADSTSPLFSPSGHLEGVVVVLHDMTAEHLASEKLAYLAQHDALTELPNRLLLVDRIAQALALTERHGRRFAVLYIDLDRFKHVNDTLGHAVGDQLLCSVARRLRKCVRASDTVSRLGGDEFAILLAEDIEEDAVDHIVSKIHVELAAPHQFGGHTLRVRCSIGVGYYPAAGRDAEQLLDAADQAMYVVKRKSGNRPVRH